MKLISFLLRSSWRMMTIAILMGLLSGCSSAGLIALISNAVGKSSETLGATLAFGFAALALIALLTSIAARVVLINLSQAAVFQLQMRLSYQILSSELNHLERLGSPRLLATLTSDIEAISQAVYILPFLCINLAIVGGCLTYITWLSWRVLLMVLVITAVALGSTQILLRKGRHFLSLAREEQDRLFQNFRSLTEGIKELKLHNQRRQDFLDRELQPTASQFRHHNVRGLTFFAITDSWGKLIFFFAIGVVLFVLPKFLVLNSQTLSGYVLTFTYLIGPMESIVSKLPLLSRADVALEKIQTLGLSLAHRTENIPDIAPIKTSWQSWEFRNVTHTYPSGEEDINFTLGEVNLSFQPGELIFIIGGNGSGKSTFAKLITGLYIPETGSICFDGKRVDDHNREWYRQHFAVIFADFYLFERLLGFTDSSLDSQAQNYLQQLKLEHKVKVKDGKLSTTALSQGQRKRLALLTAYLENRPIYLFDEWAADQDPTFKEIFYTEFLPQLQKQGKTLLVISHDDRYFHLADRIIKLEYGKIVYDKRRSPQ